MTAFLNNCGARPHADLYGPGAFYDLRRNGAQAGMATDLRPGEECVVATLAPDGDVAFEWFAFSRERVMAMPDEPGTSARVLFGERLRSDRLPKAEAAATARYAAFFDRNGHFKRRAVVRR